ncbi:MAG: hypothetical protein JNL82_41125 [Myxococcales bacterium]|nr:hypothetical protein [Myxococcales bacterium]
MPAGPDAPAPPSASRRVAAVLLRVLAVCLVFLATAPLLYAIAITLYPARTPDGHGLMPIGQVAFAVLGAFVASVIAVVLMLRRR